MSLIPPNGVPLSNEQAWARYQQALNTLIASPDDMNEETFAEMTALFDKYIGPMLDQGLNRSPDLSPRVTASGLDRSQPYNTDSDEEDGTVTVHSFEAEEVSVEEFAAYDAASLFDQMQAADNYGTIKKLYNALKPQDQEVVHSKIFARFNSGVSYSKSDVEKVISGAHAKANLRILKEALANAQAEIMK